jgi:hypothetical protein
MILVANTEAKKGVTTPPWWEVFTLPHMFRTDSAQIYNPSNEQFYLWNRGQTVRMD